VPVNADHMAELMAHTTDVILAQGKFSVMVGGHPSITCGAMKLLSSLFR